MARRTAPVPTAELIEALGTASDLALCYRFNFPYARIAQLRKERGIPAFQRRKPEPSHPADNDFAPEWWTLRQASQAWGVSRVRASVLFRRLLSTIHMIDGRRVIPKGTPKPEIGGPDGEPLES